VKRVGLGRGQGRRGKNEGCNSFLEHGPPSVSNLVSVKAPESSKPAYAVSHLQQPWRHHMMIIIAGFKMPAAAYASIWQCIEVSLATAI
jgi:hypothetical protein